MARRPKLYLLPGSHPCAAVEAALALKAIDFARRSAAGRPRAARSAALGRNHGSRHAREGGEQPNAADLQIGATIRLLMTIGDVRPLLEGRRADRLVRYFPPMVGSVEPGTLPAAWLAQPARTRERCTRRL